MVDDLDFFVETIDPENSGKYKSGERWLDINTIEEKINRKAEKIQSLMYVKHTTVRLLVTFIHY